MSVARTLAGLLKICTVTAGLLVISLPAAAQSDSASPTQDTQTSPETVGQFARHYRDYRRDIDDLSQMSFTSRDEVQNAYHLIMGYEPSDLTRGWFAHQALVASRAPGFLDMVRLTAQQRGRTQFFAQAQQDPSYLWALSSNTAAINSVFDGLYQDAREARAVGQVLSDRAYAYMDRRYGSRLPTGAVQNATEILGVDDADQGERSYEVPYRAQQVMNQVLEIAARLSLDRSGGQSVSAAGLLVDDYQTNQCLRWARLNLAQCMAAARTTAEEAYCTGRHGVDDIADCWGWMVNMDGDIVQAASAQ